MANHKRNGIDLKRLLATMDAIRGDSGIAEFQFRAEAQWMGGGHCKTKIKADAPKKQLEELCAYVQKTSPVLDIIRNPVAVTIDLVSE
ncbi:MAG: hypothetical protein GXP32_07175 [Kiritimatiellaeota bacterium]|nr:hypothetical protein [Kiritimatiellota bacterium]